MCDIVFSLQEFLKIVPGLVILPLSFYLAWKKIGNNVSCSISVGSNRVNAKRITSVVITNYKDKPVTIFEIQAVIDNDISFSVEKFNAPLVLKALESIALDTTPYSNLYFGADIYEPELISQKICIHLVSSVSVIK